MYLAYWEDVLVGMASVLTMPSGVIKYAYRQHRLVILPDYQGLGFGTKINDFLAEHFVSMGYKYFIRTTHLRLSNHLSNLPTWRHTGTSGKLRSEKCIDGKIKDKEDGGKGIIGDRRIAVSLEYMGKDYAIKPEYVVKICETSDIESFKKYISKLKNDYYVIVVTGVPEKDNEIEIAMKELGVRTEQLYYKRNGKLIESSKYKKYEYFNSNTIDKVIKV